MASKKPTVTIRMPGGRTEDVDINATEKLLERFLELAGVYGQIVANLGDALRGRPQYQDLKGIQIMKVSASAVEVRVQAGSNDTRRVVYLCPPVGLDLDKFFALLQKAEARIKSGELVEPTDHGERPAPKNQPDERVTPPDAPVDDIPTQAEVEHLADEYMSRDEEAKQAAEAAASARRRIQVLATELGTLVDQKGQVQHDLEGANRRVEELNERIRKLGLDLEKAKGTASELETELGRLTSEEKTLGDEREGLEHSAGSRESAARHLSREAEELRKQHAQAEAKLRTRTVAAQLKGFTAEDLLAAARFAGIDLSSVLKKDTAN